MTVPVPDQLEYIYDANGSTVSFSYPKRFLQKDEVVVLLRDSDNIDTIQVLNTHYTIAGSDWPNGVNVVFVTPPASGLKIVIHRMTQAKQTVNLANNQRNDAPSVELQLDRLTMALQDRSWLGIDTWLALIAEVAARVQGDKVLNNRVDQEIIDRIAGDEALASLIGNVGSGNAPLFDTNLAVSMAVISPLVNVIRTGGYSIVGDGGAALYKRVSSEPTHAGKIRSSDGAWWEMSGTTVLPQQFGSNVGIIGVDATGALQSALDYLERRGGGTLTGPSGTYDARETLLIPSNVKFDMSAGMTIRRTANTNAMILNKSGGTIGGYEANRNIRILDGTFDANGTDFPSPVTHIAFGHCKNVTVKRNTIINGAGPWHGIEFNAVKNGHASNNNFRNGGGGLVGGEAIQLDAALDGGPFPWFGPYDDTPCFDIAIEDNIVEDWATGVGSHSVPVNPNLRHTKIRIIGNDFKVTHNGISVLRWTDATIKSNRISGINQDLTAVDYSSYGIRISFDANGRTSAIRINDNIIDGFQRGRNNNGNSRGISISGDPNDLSRISRIWINDNYVLNSGRHAVGVDYSSNIQINNNEIATQEQVGIYLYGSVLCTVTGNHIAGRSLASTHDIIVASVGTSPQGLHIIQGNHLQKMTVNAASCLITNNVVLEAITGASAGGRIGPNLVAGSWV